MAGNPCEQVFDVGDAWPSDEMTDHIGPYRHTAAKEELRKVEDERIEVRHEDARMMTQLMERRIRALVTMVASEWPGHKLYIRDCWNTNPDWLREHWEGRLADLQIIAVAGGDPENDKLPRLACLCHQVGFEFIEYHSSQAAQTEYIHAGVPRDDFLYRLRPKVAADSVRIARQQLEKGWLPFVDWAFAEEGHPRVLLEGPEIALSPIPFLEIDDAMSLGDVLLIAAAMSGLYPKTYFLSEHDRLFSQPIIRLLRSPTTDLLTVAIPTSIQNVDALRDLMVAPPVTVESLELSLRRFSDDGEAFKATAGDGQPRELLDIVQALIREGKEDGDEAVPVGRYFGIQIRVHEVLKSQVIDEPLELPAWVSLTRILDALAQHVHGRWFWSGRNTIDFISRPYHEFVGS